MPKDPFGRVLCEYDGARLNENTIDEWIAILDDRDEMQRWQLEQLHQIRGRVGLRQLVAGCPTCYTLTTNFYYRLS